MADVHSAQETASDVDKPQLRIGMNGRRLRGTVSLEYESVREMASAAVGTASDTDTVDRDLFAAVSMEGAVLVSCTGHLSSFVDRHMPSVVVSFSTAEHEAIELKWHPMRGRSDSLELLPPCATDVQSSVFVEIDRNEVLGPVLIQAWREIECEPIITPWGFCAIEGSLNPIAELWIEEDDGGVEINNLAKMWNIRLRAVSRDGSLAIAEATADRQRIEMKLHPAPRIRGIVSGPVAQDGPERLLVTWSFFEPLATGHGSSVHAWLGRSILTYYGGDVLVELETVS